MGNISNEELMRKAQMLLDTFATDGKLNPKQADKFIDYVIKETILADNARVHRFTNETMDIDKLNIGRRVAVPHVEATDPGIRRGVTASKVSLTPKAIMVPFEMSDLFQTRSIEGTDVRDHVVQMMAKQFANDLEELYINGDSVGPAILESDYVAGGDSARYRLDSYLALFNGWIRDGDSGNVYDAGGANIGLSVLGAMIRQMPTKFRRNKNDLRFFMSSDLAQLYYEKLSTRSTPLGDMTASGGSHKPYGVQIVEVPLLDFLPPVVQHVTLTGTTAAALRYAPVSSVIVSQSTLSTTPETPYIETTDYVVDYTLGTIVRSGGGSAISSGQVVKVTFASNPQVILTHWNNFIIGLNTEISINKDFDIFKRVEQFAIHTSVDCQVEEDTALVKGINIGQSI